MKTKKGRRVTQTPLNKLNSIMNDQQKNRTVAVWLEMYGDNFRDIKTMAKVKEEMLKDS